MSLKKIYNSTRPEGLDPRVCAMLEERAEEWFEDGFGFGRVRQVHRDRPGYETSEAYKARDREIISWTWLADIGLIANADRIPTESERQRGFSILQEHLDQLAHHLGES
jgi:hypothetical protein